LKQQWLRWRWGVFLVVLWVCGLLPARSGAADGNLFLNPTSISIGSFFQGAELKVTAVIPGNAEAVIEVQGPRREEQLVRKGRRWGMWMNAGDLTISDIPSLYFYAVTNPALTTMPSAPWGVAALERQSQITGAVQPEGEAFFFRQFIALKESEGMYLSEPGSIATEPGPEGTRRLMKVFWLPARVPPGVYQVSVRVVQDGGIVVAKQQELPIAKVGLPSLVWALAHEQAVLYGIVAVIIALAAGFLMGFFFKSKGAH
jgi:uncharacterized protein (TIGR02186 family)